MTLSTLGQVLVNGICIGSIYAIIALGLTLIFGVLHIVNFAHGDYFMLALYLNFFAVTWFGGDVYVYLIPVSIILFLLGAGSYLLFIQPLLTAPHQAQLLVTYGIQILLQNIMLALCTSTFRSISVPYSNTVYNLGGLTISYPKLLTVIVCIVVYAVLVLFMQKHRMGKMIRASASNVDAARLMGINTNFIFMVTFGIGLALVGVASSSVLPYLYTYPTIGANFTTICFVVIVMGGLGKIYGALAAGLLIGVVEAFVSTYFAASLSLAVCFVLFVLTLMFKPEGIFGRAGR